MDRQYPNDNWTRVEVFRLAHGRLPIGRKDSITLKTIRLFLKKYDAGELASDTIDLDLTASMMKCGVFLLSAALTEEK